MLPGEFQRAEKGRNPPDRQWHRTVRAFFPDDGLAFARLRLTNPDSPLQQRLTSQRALFCWCPASCRELCDCDSHNVVRWTRTGQV